MPPFSFDIPVSNGNQTNRERLRRAAEIRRSEHGKGRDLTLDRALRAADSEELPRLRRRFR